MGPPRYLILLNFSVPLLKNRAEPVQISFDLTEVVPRDSLPLCLERHLELFPELSELLLIHMDPLVKR